MVIQKNEINIIILKIKNQCKLILDLIKQNLSLAGLLNIYKTIQIIQEYYLYIKVKLYTQ